jgi:hypothetical protein
VSLTALALQIAATGALLDVMPSWVRVEMEPREPLKLLDESGRRVLLCVFIGDEQLAPESRKRWMSGARTIELAVQVLLPPEIEAEIGGVRMKIDVHRGGTTPLYATVHRLIQRAFLADSSGSWGELFSKIVVAFPEDLQTMRGAAERAGMMAVPVIDYSIPCRTIDEPPLGTAPPAPWPLLVAKMRATPAFAGAAAYVEALIAGEPLAPWHAEQVRAGLTRDEGAALGIGALAGVEDTPEATRFTIETTRGDLVVEVGGEDQP